MTELGVTALRAERDDVLALARSLSADEWAAASDCAGWRVQDVMAHLAATFHRIADPAAVPAGGENAEADAELAVAERRDWTADAVLAEYEEWSERALQVVAMLQQAPMADNLLPLGDLGSHPMHLLADILVFDHYCHLQHDLLAPSGPIARERPAADELRLRPTVTWMMAGLPQMCRAELVAVLDQPVVLRLTGAGGGAWTLRRAPDAATVQVAAGEAADAVATITSSTEAFVVWGTKRRPWQDGGVELDGDTDAAARVADAIDVI